ncbi:MAG: DUF167 domain-containing protein [Patescibacteria group bacterium]
MKLFVTVKPNARKNEVKKIDETTYAVSVAAVPADGKANKAVIGLLAKYFDVPQSRITLKSGHASAQKIFLIE